MIGDDIDRMFMSGTVATLTLKKDAKIDEKKLKKAIEGKKLEYISLTSRKSKRATAAYVLEVPGLT